nr:thioredoxin family protein [Pseudopedobacter sp.]
MKLLSIFFLSLLVSGNTWVLDFKQAETEAKQSHKYILINFSGSDWCGPCIRTHKEIFEKDAFENYANKNLILVRADFPRLKKNQLSAEQLKKNNDLAVKYNPDGDFPLTVLTDENGKVIKEWKGFPDCSPEDFVKKVENAIN